MVFFSVADQLFRPSHQQASRPAPRILFLARHPPLEPAWVSPAFPGDGGYPAYYQRVCRVLEGLGYSLQTSNSPLTVLTAGGTADLVFSLYNRMPGVATPEVIIPSLCSLVGLPLVGAGANTRALAEDKWYCKLAAHSLGLPTLPGKPYRRSAELVTPPSFAGPYFVKNRFGAASEGVTEDSVQDDWEGARRYAERLMEKGQSVLVEAYAEGIDLTVPVLGGRQPLLLGVVQPGTNKRGGIITEDLKCDDPLGYQMVSVDSALQQSLSTDVLALWDGFGPMDYYRMDYRFNPQTGRRVFLEVNLCCHIGRSGAICLAAGSHGLDQADVLGHVVEYSLWRQGEARG